MSYFGPELWKALSRPFKVHKKGEVWNWVNVLGSLMDDARESIFYMRRLWFVKYARGWVLDLRGAERGILRWYGESDEDFQKRVNGAYSFYAAGGTVPGTMAALHQIGYEKVEIQERYPTWSKFLLTFDFSMTQSMGRREWDLLNYIVFKVKSAHTVPRYLFLFRPEPPQSIKPIFKPMMDIELLVNQKIWWNTKRLYYMDGTIRLNGPITLGDGWAEAVYLTGNYSMNGNNLMDGFTAVEDDGWRWSGNPLHRSWVTMEIKVERPFANQTYWMDGRELLDGSLKLDALKVTNSFIGHHKTYVEKFDQDGNSLGKEELK